jgi:arylsulfatase A-like enzyme
MAMGCERLPPLISAWHLSCLIFSDAVRPTAKWKSAAQKQFVNPTKSARKDNPLASFRPELTNDVFVRPSQAFVYRKGSRSDRLGYCTMRFFGGITCNGGNSSHFSVARRLHRLLGHAPLPQSAAGLTVGLAFSGAATAQTAAKPPNIVVVMGDDIGWFNVGAYHRGMMSGKTPNLDKLASEGMMFTDYYAEASCTAGRANFITGELPIRTGLTTVGQAGSPIGMPDEAPTIATALKSMGYATGQFGKNHLGDLNQFLPTVHGFDEFFGYLYHLDAMEDPSHRNYPKDLIATVGPRNMVHSWATDTDDATVMPRWGKIGKQKIEDAGTLYPKRMETVDDEIRDNAFKFLDKAKTDGKPFFLWLNPTRMHVVTHLSEKYESLRTSENGWSLQEAGMAQLDDDVGLLMKKLKDMGVDDNTIVVFTTDNGAENFTWPDGGNTPFAGGKGTALEGGFRVPALLRWPGKVPAGKVENGIFSGMDWFPTFVTAAGNPNVTAELLKGKQMGGQNYKVHLDGYDQTALITGKGPSARHEILYFTEGTLSAVRIDDYKYRFTDQPGGWLGGTIKVDWPILTNIRLDPFERMNLPNGANGSLAFYNWFVFEFWRFQFVQKEVAKVAQPRSSTRRCRKARVST